MSTLKINLPVQQGATFTKAVNWYGGGEVCHPIAGVAVGCQTALTVTGHGLPTGDTPITISGVKGTKDLNQEQVVATYVDANLFTVPIDTLGKVYTSGTGSIKYSAPTNITGYTARMQIRESIDDVTEILELTDVAGLDLIVNGAQITITMTATETAAFTFDQAVYDLEMISGTGAVKRLLEGSVILSKEVTR